MVRTYIRNGVAYTYTYVSNVKLKDLRDKLIRIRSAHQLNGVPFSEMDLNEVIEDLQLLMRGKRIREFPYGLVTPRD